MSPEARAEMLLAYARGPALLKEALGACPPEALDFRPGSGQWSVRDIAWHLAESELHAYCRARFIVAEPGVTILPYDQDRWADTLEPGNHPLEEALDLFRLLRVGPSSIPSGAPSPWNSGSASMKGTWTPTWPRSKES